MAEVPTPLMPTPMMLVCPVGHEVGGAERVMLALAARLPAYGFDPTLVSLRPGKLRDMAEAQGTRALSFPIDHRYRDVGLVLKATTWLADVARRSNARLLHATHTAHLYSSVAARRSNAAAIWHCHDEPTKFDGIDRLNRLLPADHTIYTTNAVANGYGASRHRRPHTIVPPTCVDPVRLRAQPDVADVRERLGIPTGRMLLTVARFQPHKGHSYLLDAAETILAQVPDAVFVFAGPVSDPGQKAYQDELRRQCDRLGISSRVRFVGAPSDEELVSLYRRAECLVHAAWSEGYGLVLLEAMACGLAVVAAAASGPAEIVTDGENGRLVPVRNADALAVTVVDLLANPSKRRALADAGLEAVATSNLDGMVARTVDVYRRVLLQRATS